MAFALLPSTNYGHYSRSEAQNYERHRLEQTLLYQLAQLHYSVFKSSLDDQGQSLPRYV